MAYGAGLLTRLGGISLVSSTLTSSALEGSPSGLWRPAGNRVGVIPSGVRLPRLPPLER